MKLIKEAVQKKHFLEKFFIDKADISGLGPNLKSVLASYGIETASDIDRSIQYNVPNFGPKRTKDLLEWKKKIESKFRFDPRKGIDPSDIAALNNKFSTQQKQPEDDLAKGVNELQIMRNVIFRRRTELSVQLERAAYNLSKAQADAQLL